jgi:hypothetical protein
MLDIDQTNKSGKVRANTSRIAVKTGLTRMGSANQLSSIGSGKILKKRLVRLSNGSLAMTGESDDPEIRAAVRNAALRMRYLTVIEP